ncbi:ORF6N domain-containing protein [Treponema bryantii]|uniref:ORF6N domain-containing protein n=1 Tax=Treponema bryantii TaxID=163 RepID=A0A1I3HZN3_9SPIR|nr:ORF6N domain-containing protein [Treponema bryantii]SFI41205.1 ORF6N domain-containing protein [Treponema bryantii]
MENEISNLQIEKKIFVIRGVQVMIDRDIAELYGVETKVLNQAVKRNIQRFPQEFMFQLSREEIDSVKSQFVTSRNNIFSGQEGGTRKLPYVFTEQGCAMLSAVLKSDTAVQVSIQIMKAFVSMRHFVQSNSEIFAELKSIRHHQIETDIHLNESDKKIDQLFTLMDKYNVKDTQGIFFQGQIFDAYAKFESFIQAAKKEIVLIDGYVDLSVLQRLAKRQKGVNVTIYTDPKTKLTAQDIQNFNVQYPKLTLNYTTKMHDRFMIIDNKILYHIGASLKDLGKKCFAFEILDASIIPAILQNL